MKAIVPACVALLAAMTACPAHAAEQGRLGATSSGSIAIRLSVAPRVRLSVAPVAPVVQAASHGGSPSETRPACLWSNTATRRFRLVASGNAAETASIGASPVQPACAAAGGTSASLIVPLPQARLERASLTAVTPAPLVLLVVPE